MPLAASLFLVCLAASLGSSFVLARALDRIGVRLGLTDAVIGMMTALGAETALNLDGGGSTSLVSGGRLRNRPRKDYETPEPGGRPVSTALLFLPR